MAYLNEAQHYDNPKYNGVYKSENEADDAAQHKMKKVHATSMRDKISLAAPILIYLFLYLYVLHRYPRSPPHPTGSQNIILLGCF